MFLEDLRYEELSREARVKQPQVALIADGVDGSKTALARRSQLGQQGCGDLGSQKRPPILAWGQRCC